MLLFYFGAKLQTNKVLYVFANVILRFAETSNSFEAALLAPTAVNQQKFYFEYLPPVQGNKPLVAAKRKFSMFGYTDIDLGIAKCHFEIGAGRDNFEYAE